jgi:hypothetical protein
MLKRFSAFFPRESASASLHERHHRSCVSSASASPLRASVTGRWCRAMQCAFIALLGQGKAPSPWHFSRLGPYNLPNPARRGIPMRKGASTRVSVDHPRRFPLHTGPCSQPVEGPERAGGHGRSGALLGYQTQTAMGGVSDGRNHDSLCLLYVLSYVSLREFHDPGGCKNSPRWFTRTSLLRISPSLPGSATQAIKCLESTLSHQPSDN